MRYPTLALIQGHCLGGGLELALACRYRLVEDAPGASLALPEVMLGIFPGWGGMLRLPALIGAPAALDMMLTGRGADARRAATLGLVDARVPTRLLQAAARGMVLSGKPPRRARGLGAWLNRWPLKAVAASRARKQDRRQGSAAPLPGRARHRRPVGKTRRQRPAGPGADRRHHCLGHRAQPAARVPPAGTPPGPTAARPAPRRCATCTWWAPA